MEPLLGVPYSLLEWAEEVQDNHRKMVSQLEMRKKSRKNILKESLLKWRGKHQKIHKKHRFLFTHLKNSIRSSPKASKASVR